MSDWCDWWSVCWAKSLVLSVASSASDSQHWNSLWQLLSSLFSAVGYIAWGKFLLYAGPNEKE